MSVMEGMHAIDDIEIQEKVESLAGKGTRVLDCEKSTHFQTEEVLLVNGYPVPLQGEDGRRIKQALMTGQVPPCDLLNEILIRAGILKSPVELETTVSTKSTTKTTELLTLRDRHGTLLDERMKEVEEDNEFESKTTEVWRKETGHDTPDRVLGLGKQLERITFPTSSTPPSSYSHTGRSGRSSSASEEASISSNQSPSASSSYSYSPRFSVSRGLTKNKPIEKSSIKTSARQGVHVEELSRSPERYRKLPTTGYKVTPVDIPTGSQKKNTFFQPAVASLRVELDGVPVQVSYETFV